MRGRRITEEVALERKNLPDRMLPTARAGSGQPPSERSIDKIVVLENGCWDHQSMMNRGGYHLIPHDGRMRLAHRVMYEWFCGLIPDGLTIDHLCRNRRCVNPEHLEVVTQRENSLRSDNIPATNARKTHCPQGHPYDEENTYWDPDRSRRCRICARESVRRSAEKRR